MNQYKMCPPQTKRYTYIIFVTILSSFICSLSIYFFLHANYQQTIYNSGIYGLGDAFCLLLLRQQWLIHTVQQKQYYANILYLLVNLALFFFIAFPKLDRLFNFTTIISTVVICGTVYLFGSLLDNTNFAPDANKESFCFFTIKKNFLSDTLRSILTGILYASSTFIAISIGSSTGGIDIIAKYLKVYKNISINLVITIFNYSISVIFVLKDYLDNKNKPNYVFDWLAIFLSSLRLVVFSIVFYLLNLYMQKKITKRL